VDDGKKQDTQSKEQAAKLEHIHSYISHINKHPSATKGKGESVRSSQSSGIKTQMNATKRRLPARQIGGRNDSIKIFGNKP
jgi:hypothetical protein